MTFVIETVSQSWVWLQGDPVVAAAVVLLLLGPGVACCWLGYHVSGVRMAGAGRAPGLFSARRTGAERIEQRLASMCTALSILTDSTETGLREAITGIERLSGAVAEDPDSRAAARRRVRTAADQGRTARDIAIAEGVSEGEVRLRLRLQGLEMRRAGAQLAGQEPAGCN